MAGKAAWTTADMADAIRETAGIKTAAARRLGCHVMTIDRYIERYPTVAAAYTEARAGIVDMAESVLVRRLNAGEWDAAKFVLTTLGRDRGWAARNDVDITTAGAPLTFTIQIAGRDDSDE
jgi:hypothetical protein